MQVQATLTGVPADKFRILAASAFRMGITLLAVLHCVGTTWRVSMKSLPDSAFRACNPSLTRVSQTFGLAWTACNVHR